MSWNWKYKAGNDAERDKLYRLLMEVDFIMIKKSLTISWSYIISSIFFIEDLNLGTIPVWMYLKQILLFYCAV